MYMTMEYSGAMPKELRMKICGRDRYEHAVVSWDGPAEPMRVDGDTMLLACDVKINNTWGMAAFVMHGSSVTSVIADGPAVDIKSVKFAEKQGLPGSAVDGLPRQFLSADPDRESIEEYFCRNGMFNHGRSVAGGMHEIAFDKDVTLDHIDEFLGRHKESTLGALGTRMVRGKDGCLRWRACYLYAHPDHAAVDLACWQSRDKADREG